MSIINNLYTIQSEKGNLTKAYSTGHEHDLKKIEKEILDIVGNDLWTKYTEIRDKIEIVAMEVHYKEGLKDGAKLIIELLK